MPSDSCCEQTGLLVYCDCLFISHHGEQNKSDDRSVYLCHSRQMFFSLGEEKGSDGQLITPHMCIIKPNKLYSHFVEFDVR
jgi:hypothetical protein